MPPKEDEISTSTTPITRIKSIIPNSKSKNNLFMTFFNHTDPIVKSSSQYIIRQTEDEVYNENYWAMMMPSAAYFHVYNSVLGDVFAMVYNNNINNEKTHTLSTFIISKHGCSVHPEIHLSEDSRYYPAVENLNPSLKSRKVRKALAISLLKTFADLTSDITDSLYKQADLPNKTFDWDETQAGLLASQMTLLDSRSPTDVGSYLYELGYLTQSLSTASYVVDVIYTDQPGNELLSEQNNALAYLLGKQLEQLFDPLTEYSPEPTEKVYKPPADNFVNSMEEDNELIRSICSELITVQTNYTVSLVQFLQNFIVPLRIKVLEGKIPGYTTAKLNQIFPPTIDEVTRINCIFLDMLKLARPYGSYEILKACGTTIPYFYKAQMRHEAATKNFHSNYLQFVSDVEKCHCSDLLSLDQPAVETAVYSSLNLVKLQLIIQRLVRNQTWPEQLKDSVNIYLKSCDDTISSFANDKLQPYNGRIFTPTGKILAEIAKGWPSELQFGWLTRRVVAVFDATDILTDDVRNKSVIIIFSDHALFLTIDDDEYYSELWKGNEFPQAHDNSNGKNKNTHRDLSGSMSNSDYVSSSIHKPSVSDILMHSLTNETPLNKLPRMTVNYWASINDLHALYFASSINSTGNNPNSYVRFFNEKDPSFTGIYQLDKVSGKYVTEVLARSKILNKTQSFHLFCGSISNDDLKSTESSSNSEDNTHSITKRVYYTAHEASTYNKEDTKSPFIVLFNREYNENILDEYNAYAFITLNFVTDDTVRMEGLSRCNIDGQEKQKLSYDVNVEILSASLSLILSELFSTHMSLYNPMLLDYLLANNGQVNSQAAKVLNIPLEVLDARRAKLIDSVMKNRKERDIVRSVANDKTDRRKSLELFTEDLKAKKIAKASIKKGKENKEVRFQRKAQTIPRESNTKTATRSPEKSNKNKKDKTKHGLFKFFNIQKSTTKPPKNSYSGQFKRNNTVVHQNVDSKKIGTTNSDVKPAKPKLQKKRNLQSFALFSHKPENLKNSSKETSMQSVGKAIPESMISKPVIHEMPVTAPVSPQKIVDSTETSTDKLEGSSILKHRPSNSQGDTTTLSTGIYVNSHFEFPMEPAPSTQKSKASNGKDKASTPVTPRLAPLKDEPDHTKGYKDSVDLMGKLNDHVINEDNKVYDDDLFELSSNNVSKLLQQPQAQLDSLKPNSIHSEITQADDAKIFTPNAYDFTPATKTSSKNFNDVKDSDYVDEEFYANKKENYGSNSPVRKNPWRIMTLPLKSPQAENDVVSLQRSKSFYTRFKTMREKQEKILKENGITYVRDLSELPVKDRKILSQGFIFSSSICSNLDKSMQDTENTNWTSVDNLGQNTPNEPDTKELLKPNLEPPQKTTKTIVKSASPSISVVERKVVQTTPVLKKNGNNSKSVSASSSIYLTSEDDALNTYASLSRAANVHNPYTVIHEDSESQNSVLPGNFEDEYEDVLHHNNIYEDADEQTILPMPIYHSESVPNVKLYQDDVDFFSDLNLDKVDVDITDFPDISEFSAKTPQQPIQISKVSAGNMDSNETLSPDFTIRDLTIGNLDDTTMDSHLDTSLCSAIADQTPANMLLSMEDNKVMNKEKTGSNNNFSRSDTAFTLNALLKNKSYAYLQDVFSGKYESGDNIPVKNSEASVSTYVPNGKDAYLSDFDAETCDPRDSALETTQRRKENMTKSKLKREMTDYDIVYYQRLLDSSMNYLSSYTNNEEVF